ncbi:hypothetical protein ACMGDI_03445 [Morganella morganii]|uniref:hypothetical protein n=1 Tax=Morganella morganii TaxID=582 RepID=UPI0034D5372E
MKKTTIAFLFALPVVAGANTIDPLFSKSTDEFRGYLNNKERYLSEDELKCNQVTKENERNISVINSCIKMNVPKLNDKQSPASEIATAIVYKCESDINNSLMSFYEINKCNMTKETGKPLSFWTVQFDEYKMKNVVNQSAYNVALLEVLEFRNKKK